MGQTNERTGGDEIVFYKNTGTAAAPKFAAPAKLDLFKGQMILRAAPYVVDWDGDGKRDMLVGDDEGKLLFLRNTGTNVKPVFAAPEEIKLPGLEGSIRARIAVVDWNNRGKLDLVVGTYYYGGGADKRSTGGNVWLFSRK